jgi:hypothetical protein
MISKDPKEVRQRRLLFICFLGRMITEVDDGQIGGTKTEKRTFSVGQCRFVKKIQFNIGNLQKSLMADCALSCINCLTKIWPLAQL